MTPEQEGRLKALLEEVRKKREKLRIETEQLRRNGFDFQAMYSDIQYQAFRDFYLKLAIILTP